MTDEDRQDHEAKADSVERELDDLEERSGSLQDDIEGAGEDWERKKGDPGVPGAPEETGEPGEGDGEGGDIDPDQLDFGREVDQQEILGESGPPEEDDDEDEDSS